MIFIFLKTFSPLPRYNIQDGKGAGTINANEQLEQMIDKYQNLVYSICYRLTGDYFEAEDLAQDTFLSAYKNLASFDGQNERAWLCRIATNKCIDYLKRAGRRSVPTEDSFFVTVPADSRSPENTALDHAIREELLRCCLSLSPPYRAVALDYFYHELSIQEIAGKTGRNLKTLQTQLYRAKAMLRKLYGKEGTL